ncbi:glycosyl transferase [Brunnivagina elsteri]|uniref:Glycosyl transferase n=1 Tax=Brunnivagina elsteri CCALA 953 TaxID=987040 RepID=A0A2A2TQB6_9CYAN|nr:glycosyl transferase [Calothrix elsteri]PAX60607.1 glycosyl transferase [Calothrix elsteri CCALA 953]
MQRPTIYIAITNHGFGHATRTASVAATIQKLLPEVLLILTTTAPRWLLECYIEGDFIHRQRAYDLGVVQADSLTMDKPATLEKLLEIQKKQKSIVATEVDFIQQNRVDLILGDIPFLTPIIAKQANIPCWMISNFSWDFIYRDWGCEFIAIADWISECYGMYPGVTPEEYRTFRLPFHEPMQAFPNITDIGLTGGSPRYSETEIRAIWNIHTAKEKTILLTFGGLGLQQIPYHNLKRFPDWQFITFDASAPDLPNLIKIADKKCRPVDLMPACSRVLSKPGFGTFSEATKLDLPIVSVTRNDFAEAAFLIEGISNYNQHQILTPQEFFEGDWDFINQPLQQPRKTEPIAKDGNEFIAKNVINFFKSIN